MNKRVLVIIFCVIVLAGLTYAYTQKNIKPEVNTLISGNTSQGTVQENKEQASILKKDNNVIITQQGPRESKKRGTNVPIYCTITNKYRSAIYNTKAWNQLFDKNIGTLKPGETKKFTYMLHIPTDSDMEADMPGSGPLPNPYDIGKFYITFKDVNGAIYQMSSNSLKIKWHN